MTLSINHPIQAIQIRLCVVKINRCCVIGCNKLLYQSDFSYSFSLAIRKKNVSTVIKTSFCFLKFWQLFKLKFNLSSERKLYSASVRWDAKCFLDETAAIFVCDSTHNWLRANMEIAFCICLLLVSCLLSWWWHWWLWLVTSSFPARGQ